MPVVQVASLPPPTTQIGAPHALGSAGEAHRGIAAPGRCFRAVPGGLGPFAAGGGKPFGGVRHRSAKKL